MEQAAVLTSERGEALRLGRSHLSRYMRLSNYRNSWLRQGSRKKTSQATVVSDLSKDSWLGAPRVISASGCENTLQLVRTRCACR